MQLARSRTREPYLDDLWSPVRIGLRESNTRFLVPHIADKALGLRHGAKVLELGVGTGVAMMHLRYLRPDLEIHGAGLSSLDPHHSFKDSHVLNDLLNKSRRALFWALRHTLDIDREIDSLPHGMLLDSRWFGNVEAPVFTDFYLGDVLTLDLRTGYYDLIFEQAGPFYHCSETGKAIMGGKISEALSNSGVFLHL